jgi:hypothetical protein
MAKKVKIEKIKATTIVTTYDTLTPAEKNIKNYNKRMDVTFDIKSNIVYIDRGTVSNPLIFLLTELEGVFTSLNLEDLSQEFATKGLFTGTELIP